MLDIDTQVTEAILHPFILTWENVSPQNGEKIWEYEKHWETLTQFFKTNLDLRCKLFVGQVAFTAFFCRVQLRWVGRYKTQLFVLFAWGYPQHVLLARCLNGFDISALCTKPLISILANRFITSFTQRFLRRYLRHSHKPVSTKCRQYHEIPMNKPIRIRSQDTRRTYKYKLARASGPAKVPFFSTSKLIVASASFYWVLGLCESFCWKVTSVMDRVT